MPKQRHHQHQRRRGVSRYGLRLPWMSFSGPPTLGAPTIHYPEGWTPRAVRPWYLILWLGLAGLIVVVLLLVVLVISLFGGH